MAFSFGAPAPASSSTPLGAAPAQNGSAAPNQPFGGFSTPNPQQNTGNTGGLFGAQPAAPAATSFGFGTNSTNKPFGTTSTGGFGATQAQPQQNMFGTNSTAPTGGPFGSTNNSQQQTQPSGGLFGNTSTNQQTAPTNNMFGSLNQQNNNVQTGSLFGSAPQQQQNTSFFGNQSQQQQQQQQPQSTSFFGSVQQTQSQQQQQNSLFASTAGQSVLGNSMNGNQRREVDIGERMSAVQRSWDNNSPDCRFKYFFYNVVGEGQAQQYGRPAGANDDLKWTKAVRENPDPSSMVPVLATGWEDVKKRSQMQEQIASVHQHKIKEISQALTTLSRQTNLTTSIRLSALQNSLTELQHRLIHLAAQSPAFIPTLQSSALRTEELETKKTLEGVKAELDGKRGGSAGQQKGYGLGLNVGTPKKGGGSRMLGQVNELRGQVEDIRRHRGRRAGGGEKEGWLSDERVLGEVAEVLSTQQMALQKLNDLATNAVFDADVMRQSLGLISPHERNAS